MSIIPLFAVVLSGHRWLAAPLIACVASAIEPAMCYAGIQLRSADYKNAGELLCTYAPAVKWLVTALFVLVSSVSYRMVRQTQQLREPAHFGGGSTRMIDAVVLLIALAVAGFVLSRWFTWAPHLAQHAGYILTLAVCSWYSIRFLGVLTASWSLIPTTVVYAWIGPAGNLTPTWSGLCLVSIVLVAWACYLSLLRVLQDERAFLLDLTIVLACSAFLTNSEWLVGRDQVRMVSPLLFGQANADATLAFQIALSVGVVAAAATFVRFSRKTRDAGGCRRAAGMDARTLA
ncbi:MAG: hypothetical protein QM783_05230 [Phycisphaerales bacterium]